jgi:hypothetical protein
MQARVWKHTVEALRRPIDPALGMGELVRAATLAANSHNTQPWRFELGADVIRVLPDRARRTPVVDPDDHHLWVSLGAAAENIVQAAPLLGLRAEPRLTLEPEPEQIEIALRPGERLDSALARAIVHRQCTRRDYDGHPVSDPALRELLAAGSGDDIEPLLLIERARIDALGALILEANHQQLADPAFVRELKHWLRFSYGRALSSGDGLFARVTGNPALPDALGRALFDLVVRPASEARRYRAQIQSSAGLVVFVSARDDRAHWVAAGRAYERFALQATALGIQHAFLNQALEIPVLRRRVAEELTLGARRPDLIVRFGYAPVMPHSLRRPLAEVLIGSRAAV